MSSGPGRSFPIMIGKLRRERVLMNRKASRPPAFLEHGITMLMRSMKVPRSQSSLLIQDLAKVALCTNMDKSLVGVHSAIANAYFQRLAEQDDLPNAEIGAVIAATNSTLRATLDWSNSFEVSRELLSASVA